MMRIVLLALLLTGCAGVDVPAPPGNVAAACVTVTATGTVTKSEASAKYITLPTVDGITLEQLLEIERALCS